jgi:hypothetical protein
MSTDRYRVWCLSWEDAEERGSDIVPYNLLTHDYRQDRGIVYVLNVLLHDAAAAAEAYASYVHDNYEASWPLKFRVRCPNGSIQDFEIEREIIPAFKAALVKTVVPDQPSPEEFL